MKYFYFSLLVLLFSKLPMHSLEAKSDVVHKRTICLNMIVKDEESVIEHCLTSVKGMIDYWVIVDTGSSDQTQKVIQNFMKDVPGELHQSKWVNFELNRNEALNLSRNKGDYLLFIDADEVLVFDEGFKWPTLDKDCYTAIVQESKGISYQRPLLIDSSLDWNWSGVLHEALVSFQAKEYETLKGVVNYSHSEDGARARSEQISQRC